MSTQLFIHSTTLRFIMIGVDDLASHYHFDNNNHSNPLRNSIKLMRTNENILFVINQAVNSLQRIQGR